MPDGRRATAAVEEDSVVVVVAFMVVVVSAAAVSTVEASEAVAALAHSAAALEPGAAEVELASAERACQGELPTLLAQDPASLHLGILHTGSLSIMDELPNRQLPQFAQQQRLIGRRIVPAQHAMWLGNGRGCRLILQPPLLQRVRLEQLHNAD